MKKITAAQAAQQLGISTYSVMNYLTSGRLNGDTQAGLVDADSLYAYRARITPRHAEIIQALADDLEISERDRDILERRAEFEKLADIGDAHGITKSRVAAIIRHILARAKSAEKTLQE